MLSWSRITGEGFHVLQGKFTHMEKLSLGQCRGITQQGLLEILKMCGCKLQNLDISNTNITGQGLEELHGKFADLKTLDLSWCGSLTDQGLLKVLMISGSKLQDLNITQTNITGQGLDELKGKLADLKTLSIQWCSSLTDQGLLKVLRICGTKLKDLDISSTGITGQGLEELQGKFVDLRTLNLDFCYSLSDQGFSEIINISGPLLETVKLFDSWMSTEVRNRISLNRPNLTIEGGHREEYEDEDWN